MTCSEISPKQQPSPIIQIAAPFTWGKGAYSAEAHRRSRNARSGEGMLSYSQPHSVISTPTLPPSPHDEARSLPSSKQDAPWATAVPALAFSPLDPPYAGITEVRAACEPDSLRDFTWGLFESWMALGAPPEEEPGSDPS